MGRASLAGIETAPDSDIGELLVSVASLRELRGKKSPTDRVPGAHGGRITGTELVA